MCLTRWTCGANNELEKPHPRIAGLADEGGTVLERNGVQDKVPVGRGALTVLGILLVSVLALGALGGCGIG
jgi:hypothetical protein